MESAPNRAALSNRKPPTTLPCELDILQKKQILKGIKLLDALSDCCFSLAASSANGLLINLLSSFYMAPRDEIGAAEAGPSSDLAKANDDHSLIADTSDLERFAS